MLAGGSKSLACPIAWAVDSGCASASSSHLRELAMARVRQRPSRVVATSSTRRGPLDSGLPVEQAMLAEARADVAMADHKASMVLASLGIGFAALLGGLLAGDWEPSSLELPGLLLWWSGTGMAAGAVGCAAAAVWPRYKTVDVSDGVTYWGHVAMFPSVAALSSHLDDHPPSTAARTRTQLWHLSRIVFKKYRLIRWAIGLAAGSVSVLVLGIALG